MGEAFITRRGGGGGTPGGSGGYGVDGVSNRFVYSDDESINLKWKDPPDFVVDGVTVVEWDHTDLVRKVDVHPITEQDGTLIVRNNSRDAYDDTPFADENVIGGTRYCYTLFPVSKDGVITIKRDGRLRAWLGGVSGPGPQTLLAGDIDAGFYGEVPVGDLISGDDLAEEVGLDKTGTAQFSDEGWLKFAFDGKTLFVAKKAIRHSISWDHLNTAKVVYGDEGDTVVHIDGLDFKVRLLRGLGPDYDPKVNVASYAGEPCHYSEWNRLMCPIHQEAINKNWAYKDNIEQDIAEWAHSLGSGTSGRYTDSDLLTHYNYGNGSYSWCQEIVYNTSNRLGRGYYGVSFASFSGASGTFTFFGWRPCLELIS